MRPSAFIPVWLKEAVKRSVSRHKYKVKLGKNVSVSLDSTFEPNVVINDSCSVFRSVVGQGTYISRDSKISCVKIGRFCSIGQGVQTGFGLHPSRSFVSTHPSFFSTQKQAGFTFVTQQLFQEHKFVGNQNKFYVLIGNDVWIGNDVKIADGVTVGDGAIIGMGSIVTKDIEPYSINVGIPSRKIGYRFDQAQIEFLLNFKWWDHDLEWLKSNHHLFTDINEFVSDNTPEA